MCVCVCFVCLLKLFKDVAYKSTVKERERERERNFLWGREGKASRGEDRNKGRGGEKEGPLISTI